MPDSKKPLVKAPTTERIVRSLTRAITKHELRSGDKLKEQQLADQFGVSRTLVRQALYQMSQKHLIIIEPARGAFVASPSKQEAREVFAVRQVLEVAMVKNLIANLNDGIVAKLRAHIEREKKVLHKKDNQLRVETLADFHVRMAELSGNRVLAQALHDLISRCALITLLFQTENEASHSHDEHVQILDALAARNEVLTMALMHTHLQHVARSLNLESQE